MTRHDLHEVALGLYCPYCAVLPGHRCRTYTGLLAGSLHSARSEAPRAAWCLGFADGRNYEKRFSRADTG